MGLVHFDNANSQFALNVMNFFSKFQNRLQTINASVFNDAIPDLSEEMARSTQRLRAEYGDISRGAADGRGIALAVVAYMKSRSIPDSYRDLKYLCFGAGTEYGLPLTRIIEEPKLFIAIMDAVEYLISEPRKFRRCYQGLLKTYFRYPGHLVEAKGRKNWLLLRDFLFKHCHSLQKHKPALEWIQFLDEHKNLLCEAPCKRYGKALLDGDVSPIEELKDRLGIDDDTWVMQELILAPIQASTELSDDHFKPLVHELANRLDSHRLLASRGVATLLQRYSRCQEKQEHPILREMALREWKSPWLESNRPLWHAQIGIEATEMVSLWLKKRTIQDFFELLQTDGQADRQRMEFWLKYAEFMEEIWLALGTNSLYNNKSDYKRIRQQMEGRYMALEGGNYANDNAFLMKIGSYVFIEFGKQSNACHVYDADNLPFKPRQKSVLGTQDGLKNTYHPGHRGKLMHREGWQRDFSYFLSDKSGAVTGQERYPRTKAKKLSTQGQEQKPVRSPNHQASRCEIDIVQLLSLCKTQGHISIDHRDRGGALWVYGSDFSSDMIKKLRQAGFQYKTGKHGWWLA